MYKVYDSQTDIVHTTHNVHVDESSIYSHKTDYDYSDKK